MKGLVTLKKGITMQEEECIRSNEDPVFLHICKERLSEKEESLGRKSELFKLLAAPLRMRVLFLLLQGRELCVCDLADVTGSRIPALSQQLRRLHDRGLLEKRREGRTILYRVAPAYEKTLRKLMEAFEGEREPEEKEPEASKT